jgi:hypothetical protein
MVLRLSESVNTTVEFALTELFYMADTKLFDDGWKSNSFTKSL